MLTFKPQRVSLLTYETSGGFSVICPIKNHALYIDMNVIEGKKKLIAICTCQEICCNCCPKHINQFEDQFHSVCVGGDLTKREAYLFHVAECNIMLESFSQPHMLSLPLQVSASPSTKKVACESKNKP